MSEPKVNSVSKNMYIYRFSWLHLTRPMTFTGTISPILAGTLFASKKSSLHYDRFFVFIIAALFVQASVNMLNDYFDFQNGQDSEKWALHDGSEYINGPRYENIPYVVSVLLILAFVMGVWLAIQSSLLILAVGATGVLFGYFYSAGTRSLSSLGFGEMTAAIFLGLVPATLAYMVQGNTLDIHILSLSLPFAFLISSMILSNNIRDFEKDKNFLHTLVMKLGRVNAAHLLTILLVLAYFWVSLLICFKLVHLSLGMVVFSIPLAIQLRFSLRPGANRADEINGMKWAARHHWAFGLLFAFGLWLTG
jgi:1,4-dihydroxy-2-naphthoate polyprenyltransferase